MKEIQELLGHATMALTSDTYTSVILELHRTSADAAATLIPATTPRNSTREHQISGLGTTCPFGQRPASPHRSCGRDDAARYWHGPSPLAVPVQHRSVPPVDVIRPGSGT
ncbi:MAG: hypothetical protein QOG75_3361 [Mycobacterium sp.]|nr:hypothetical protein [Mycobacterium sp.]